MSDKYNPPNAPKIAKDFNEAAKQEVNKTLPPPSDKGIHTKAELDKRTEQTRILRERMERKYPLDRKIGNNIGQTTSSKKFEEDKKAFELNEAAKAKIALALKRKKEQEMAREFNRAASPSKS